MSRREHRAAKFGSWERSLAPDEHLTEVGRAEGIRFAFEKIERTSNTLDAHRLIRLADLEGVQEIMMEALFRACFRGAGPRPYVEQRRRMAEVGPNREWNSLGRILTGG
jgi:predicted DsbA family dithiol-disulfide isomerase